MISSVIKDKNEMCTEFWLEKVKERDHLKDVGTNGE
jgi:hypothetical protein